MRGAQLLILFFLACFLSQTFTAKPHILFILADDFGWADVGFHRETPDPEVLTPQLDLLVKEGIELDQHYVFKFCSPSRSALQSGRNPIHVNVQNLSPTNLNPKDPISGYSAIPRNMTGIAEKMKMGGYSTHQVGKWDAGMATPQHTPQGRGYDTSLGYFHHANDYWRELNGECDKKPVYDLWNTSRGAAELLNPTHCSQQDQIGCVYEDGLFLDHVLKIIDSHDPQKPLFLFWAPHNVHTPLQVPESYFNQFSFITDRIERRYYHAMVKYMDDAIAHVTGALRIKGMWDNTLIVFSSDNGGPIYTNGTAGANNYPLRGGKASNWQGGIRVNAFASGGYIPKERRGTKEEGYICLWDWYATFAGLAGVSPEDEKAKKAGLPPIDSHDMWPLLSGKNKSSPRKEIPIGSCSGLWTGETKLNGLIQGDYKLLVGDIVEAGWTGPKYPNGSTNWMPMKDTIAHCGTGCLFDIKKDPTEHHNIAADNKEIVTKMSARMKEIEATLFSPDRGPVSPKACEAALNTWKGFWGPFVFLDKE